ncbi:MAG TPA: biopolymer transporter ExbD [Rhizomicrobium sp.]|jgi:biopolymer transport protein ExbD
MAMNVSSPDGADADLNTSINTTPLVDVMLVLLIIFLITIPVIVKTVPLQLPNAKNIATTTKPENIVIAVDRNENVYWNNQPVADNNELIRKMEDAVLRANAAGRELPEVHIRGDVSVPFKDIGIIVYDCQRASIPKVGFLLEPHNDQ